MFARERKEALVAYIRRYGKASIHDLARKYDVTEATIRTDLRELEKDNLVIRTHGGAMLNRGAVEKEDFLSMRREICANEKTLVANEATKYVKDGDVLLIDSGTTMLKFAQQLADFQNLKVVTNDFNIALELQRNLSIEIIFIGGRVRNRFECTFGSLGVEFLKKISVDKIFLSPNNVSVEQGLTTPNEETAAMKRAMLSVANEAYMLCDSSKIGKKTFYRFADLDEFKVMITDDGITRKQQSDLEEAGLKVVVCKGEEHEKHIT